MAQQIYFGSTPADREIAFIALYKKAFPTVAKYVSKMGGTFDEAKDIFQDALVIYYEKTVNATIKLHSNEQAYLLGISKHLWAKKFRKNINQTLLDDSQMDFVEEDDPQPSANKLMYYLETAGQKCMEILKAFYYDNLPVNKITELFGYSGVRSATVQKYKCMEKVRETIKERSLAYEDFVE
ncbi:sigma-70 family RNA polymerase sigma factor [Mucilaginibacter sp.]|uniref:RNA polymerase sigma factor n=1 Tax=Mucilaginibacter sp. TaxID=1882438 RepID=UPI00283CD533|nr:sigma-70 family RNA polymerase sigma factor [Mucilaginibacter sp.]MDR3693614.1 sigma-70 family RNA polymerase sigma factor [Mucilaginibacter sp.]